MEKLKASTQYPLKLVKQGNLTAEFSDYAMLSIKKTQQKN